MEANYERLANLHNLKSLSVNFNSNIVTPQGVENIGKSLNSLQKLTSLKLNLGNTDINDQALEKFYNTLTQ